MTGPVLVTGGSGFVGAWCIVKLIEAGYRVRTTVRSLAREDEVRVMLRQAGCEAGERLSFVEADLMSDAGWRDAAVGCEYVLHVASPLPIAQPTNEDELIVPAREGALRVLRAAREAGVRRVVLTSSFAAVGYGHSKAIETFTEEHWTNPEAQLAPYIKSKTLAERAAWDLIRREGGALELATVNPVVILGPALSADFSASLMLVKAMLDGRMPVVPKLSLGLVDVRDVADLHLLAMTDPAAAGQRFVAVAGRFLSMQEIARVLQTRMGSAASRVSTRVLPNWTVRLTALFNATARLAATPELGRRKNASSAKARDLLGWSPRPPDEAIVAAAESLVELGLVRS